MTRTIVRGERVVLPDSERAASLYIADGRIIGIGGYHEIPAGVPVLEEGSLVVMPGLIDTHVHINDPGRADWEGFDSATRAAAAGGVTTLVDMPLNSIPATTSLAGFDAKLRAAEGRCHVDVGFWGGVVPGNTPELAPLSGRGVLGFKAFLSPSGVEEFEHVGEEDLRRALPVLARLRVPLLVHAELPEALRPIDPGADPRVYRTWLDSRPPAAETAAVELLIALAREYRARIHVVHLASADALPRLRSARAAGVAISVETCPHYLTFCAEEIQDGRTEFKCAPPVRGREQRERLWQALRQGDLDLVATDHSPAPPALKRLADGDFAQGWGGISSLQLGLAAIWTGASGRGATRLDLARWMSAAPAALSGLDAVKGSIAAGRNADLVIWDPDAAVVVEPNALEHRHKATPYAGLTLLGRVHKTLLAGEVIYDEGRFLRPARGRPILGRAGANISP